MNIKDGPIIIEEVDRDIYRFASFPNKFRENLIFRFNTTMLKSSSCPEFANGILYCPGKMTKNDSFTFYIHPNYIKHVHIAIKMFNNDILKFYKDLYNKRLPR